MVEIGTILQNRYLIEHQIGAGGMGAVYRAIDQKFNSPVAIKETFFNEDELRRAFEREARLLHGLHHPVLPHVSDFFTEGNKHFLVMEYIEGEDLSEVLKREGKFDSNDVLRWTDSLLDALDYLHSQEPPIIHRDIKPQNLKLTKRGDIILLDFGLAKLNSADTTGVKSVFGYSRKYSPLEQIQGTGTDARADIFSLGATVYHLLAGKPALDALARAAVIVAGNPDPLPLVSEINEEVPVAVAQVLQAALALNAERRFVSARAARAALKHALNSGSIVDAKDLPKEIVAVVRANNEPENKVETENFPALEAFAAKAENSAENVLDKPTIQVSIPPSTKSDQPVRQTTSSHSATVGEVKTTVKSGGKKTLVTVFASVAALLISGGLAIWLFSGSSKSSPAPATQVSPAQSTPVQQPPSRQTEDVSAETTPNVSEPAVQTKTETSRVTSTVESKKPINSVNERPREQAAENESPKRTQNETTIAAPAPRPQRPSNNRPAPRHTVEETRPRVIEQQPPVSSIEKVMTGGTQTTPNAERPRNPRRDARRENEQLSDQEKEELRRRRIDEILRRNRQPVPPN